MPFDPDVAAYLSGKRIMPDVSVLLTGLIVNDSDSAALFAHAGAATLLLSDHTEETALHILRTRSPKHLGAFGVARVRLATRTTVERIGPGDPATLPSWATSALDPKDDQQVLADAVAGKADILFVQDAAFFGGPVPGLIIQTPSDPMSPLRMLAPLNRGVHPEVWTVLALFIPNWESKSLAGYDLQFYIFEIADHIACYYDAGEGAFKLKWRTQSGTRDTLTIPIPIDFQSSHFVAVAVGPTDVFWFVDGETRGRRVRLGPAPAGTRFAPGNSAAGQYQINGVIRVAVVPKTLTETVIRKHWRAHTVRLTDREIELHDLVGPLLRAGA
jgi:predicted nucleic acid-binding protein